jgi:hypothetical protein
VLGQVYGHDAEARERIAVQQKLTRHGDIRTTMNVYGDVVFAFEPERSVGSDKIDNLVDEF